MPDPLDSISHEAALKSINDILKNITDYNASGKQPKNIYTSQSKLPGTALQDFVNPKGNNIIDAATYSRKSGLTVAEMQKSANLTRIDELLSSINLDLPKAPPEPIVGKPTSPLNALVGKLGAALNLLTYSEDLNSGEAEELKARQKYGSTSFIPGLTDKGN